MWEFKMVQPFWKMAWQYHTINIELYLDLAISFLGIYLREMKNTHTQTKQLFETVLSSFFLKQ